MKWLTVFMSFLFGRLNAKAPSLRETAIEVFDEVSRKSRRVVSLSMTAFGSIILFCGGFFIALLDTTAQYDRSGEIFLTATLAAGLALLAVSVIIFSYVFLRAWPGAHPEKTMRFQSKETPNYRPPSSLENALAALVMDFVKERESRRNMRETQQAKEEESREWQQQTAEPHKSKEAFH